MGRRAIFPKGSSVVRDRNGEDVIYLKGDTSTTPIRLRDVDDKLFRLGRVAQVPVKDLDPDNLASLNSLIGLLKATYGTSAYETLLNRVLAAFRDVEVLRPGTVAAICKGCFVDSNFDGPSACMAVCAGSLPPPSGTPGWAPCGHTVLLVETDGTLRTVAVVGDKKTAYVFFEEGCPLSNLTAEHSRQLSEFGTERVNLLRQYGSGYQHMTEGFVPLASLPLLSGRSLRPEKAVWAQDPLAPSQTSPASPAAPPPPSSGLNGKVVGGAAVVVVLLIVVVLLVWFLSTRR